MITNYIVNVTKAMDGQSKHRKMMFALDVAVKLRNILRDETSNMNGAIKTYITDRCYESDEGDRPLPSFVIKLCHSDLPIQFIHEFGDVQSAIGLFVRDGHTRHVTLKILSESIDNMRKIILDEELRVTSKTLENCVKLGDNRIPSMGVM